MPHTAYTPRLYLAGPEVFLPNAQRNAAIQRKICHAYGFSALHPMDNNINLGRKDLKIAERIYEADKSQVRQCDIIVANCNPFRGVCMDDGTAYEIGYGHGIGKGCYGYIKEAIALNMRTVRDYPHFTEVHNFDLSEKYLLDKEGYELTDDFGTFLNLMIQCGLHRLVIGDFERCVQAIRVDIDSGKLKFPERSRD